MFKSAYQNNKLQFFVSVIGDKKFFIGLLLSELAVRRIGVAMRLEHFARRLQSHFAVRTLHGLQLIPVLNRVMVLVELEGAAGELHIGLHHCSAEGVFIKLATGCLEGCADQFRRVIALARIDGGLAVILGHEALHEGIILGILEIGVPMRGGCNAKRCITHSCRDALIERGSRHHHRDLILEARLRPLLQEGDARAAGVELEDGVGLRCTDARHFSGEVRLVEACIDLFDHLTAIHALEAGESILTRLIIGGEENHLLVTKLLGECAS